VVVDAANDDISGIIVPLVWVHNLAAAMVACLVLTLLGVHVWLIYARKTTYEYLTTMHNKGTERPYLRESRESTLSQEEYKEVEELSDESTFEAWSPEEVSRMEGRLSFHAKLGIDDPYYSIVQTYHRPWYRGSIYELPVSVVTEMSFVEGDMERMIIGTPTLEPQEGDFASSPMDHPVGLPDVSSWTDTELGSPYHPSLSASESPFRGDSPLTLPKTLPSPVKPLARKAMEGAYTKDTRDGPPSTTTTLFE